MATLTIRNLPDEVHDSPRVRAAQNGRSMEAEARQLIADPVGAKPKASAEEIRARVARLQQRVAEFIPPGSYSVDQFLAEKRAETALEEERWARLEREAADAARQASPKAASG